MSTERAPPELLAAYGLLMTGVEGRPDAIVERLVSRGPCRMRGRLVDLGGYPGLVSGAGEVVGELLALPDDPEFLFALDRFEDFDPGSPEKSLYVRERVRLLEPAVEAWAYRYNRDPTGAPIVPEGDWRRYVALKGPEDG